MATSTINWTIVAEAGRYRIYRPCENIGSIRTNGSKWTVKFKDHPELDFEWGGTSALDICVGYVRGVERCAVLQNWTDGPILGLRG